MCECISVCYVCVCVCISVCAHPVWLVSAAYLCPILPLLFFCGIHYGKANKLARTQAENVSLGQQRGHQSARLLGLPL